MTANQIIMLIIIVLTSIIVVFGIYFLIIFLLNKKREKKLDTIFNPTNLVEENSLMNMMDEKRNLEFTKEEDKHQDRFVVDQEMVDIIAVEENSIPQSQKANPFGVDMTMRTKDNTPIEPQSENRNKFIN